MRDQTGQSDAGAEWLTRAAFLRLAGAAALAAGAAPWFGPRRVAHAASTDVWVLQLDGSAAGRLHAFSGGKRVSGSGGSLGSGAGFPGLNDSGFEPIKMAAGFGLADSFYTWIASMADGQAKTRDGSIFRTDTRGVVLGETRFLNAVLTEATIPGCDASL